MFIAPWYGPSQHRCNRNMKTTSTLLIAALLAITSIAAPAPLTASTDAPIEQTVLVDDSAAFDAALAAQSDVKLVRSGIYREQRIAVVRVSAEVAGRRNAQNASGLDLPGTRAFEDASQLDERVDSTQRSARTQAAVSNVPSPQPYQAARGNARIIRVSQPGMQDATLPGVDANTVCLQFRGQPVALQVRGPNSIRFYAAEAGDRYNNDSVYWALTGQPACPRMAGEAAGDVSGAASGTALERGSFKPLSYYYEYQPGPDGDHWFGAYLAPNQTWSVSPSSPLAGTGPGTRFVVRGVMRSEPPSTGLPTTLSGIPVVNPTQSWLNGSFESRFETTATGFPSGFVNQSSVILVPNEIAWEARPVTLNFTGGGADFYTNGPGVYEITSPGELYDVTDPVNPIVVSLSANRFRQTAAGQRSYIMAKGNNTRGAVVQNYAPAAELVNALNRRALYIAPQAWIADGGQKLQALVNFRNGQGWNAQAIPVETIYGLWGFGHVSPEAIREFVQWQYNASSTKPEALIIVGAGVDDWRGLTGLNAPRVIPPYMADVDKHRYTEFGFAAETACEPCFSQLNGDSPLDDMVPDLMFGRMPARDIAALNTSVDKIVRYETLTTDLSVRSWRGRVAYLTDNYIRPRPEAQLTSNTLTANPIPDGSGNFWAMADRNIGGAQAAGPEIVRRYYDPYGAYGRAPNAVSAPQWAASGAVTNIPYNTTQSVFNDGAAFINYLGHGAATNIAQLEVDAGQTQNWLLRDDDVARLNNTDRLPFMLMMTCATGSFHLTRRYQNNEVPLDAALFLAGGNRGAIAVWGSTGLGVTYNQESLINGFYRRYWQLYTVNNPPAVGYAAQAGYVEAFQRGGDVAEDILRTFQITGDPLTRVRAYVPGALPRTSIRSTIGLPVVRR
jgi:Peptidase family C25